MALSIKELISEADRCVACGLCLPHCPTYRKTGSEADSPRGRIQLMRAVAQDILPNNARFNEHIDLCLNCRSCESVCPNTVNYGQIVDSARVLYMRKKSLWFTIAKPFIRHRFLQYCLSWTVRLVQLFKLEKLLIKQVPAARLLPAMHKPVLWKSFYPATAKSKGGVSLFLGCATNTFDNQTILGSITLLNKLGFDVHIPTKQTCCGSISRQMGDVHEAESLIQQNQSTFAEHMPIITVASGCGAGLNDYLPSHRIIDISTFLVSCDWSTIHLKPFNASIYVQDPCTLRNVQKSHQAVYHLLHKIPEADIRALPGNAQCCGGAGAYMLTQSDMATQLRDDKITSMQTNKVNLLATSNIGCSLHIAEGLRAQHLKISIEHPINIIAKLIQ